MNNKMRTDQQQERRSTTRAPVGRPARLQFDDTLETAQGTCGNLSTGGMFVSCNSERPAGSLVRFEVHLDDVHPIRGLGEVIWSRSEGPESGLGISFRFLEKHDRQQILKLLSEEIKRRLENQAAVDAEPWTAQPAEAGQAARWPGSDEGVGAERASEATESRPQDDWDEPAPTFASAPVKPQTAGVARAEIDDPELDAAIEELENPTSHRPMRREAAETSSIPLRLPSEPFDELVGQGDSSPEGAAESRPTTLRLSRLQRGGRRPAGPGARLSWPVIVGAVVLLLAVIFSWWLARQRGGEMPAPAPGAVEQPESTGAVQEVEDEMRAAAAIALPAAEEQGRSADGLVSGPRSFFTRLVDISWVDTANGGLRVVLQADGEIPPANVGRFQLAGTEPREGVVLRGARQRYQPAELRVGGPRVSTIRTGYHRKPNGAELHVIFDLLEPSGPRPELSFLGDKLEVLFAAS